MTNAEFNDAMQIMIDTYGQVYQPMQLTRLAQFVKNIPKVAFESILENLIDANVRAPSINVIKQGCRTVVGEHNRRLIDEKIEKAKIRGLCRFCASTGIITAFPKKVTLDGSGCGTAFQCTYCEVARLRHLSPAIVPWRKEFELTFIIGTDGKRPDYPWPYTIEQKRPTKKPDGLTTVADVDLDPILAELIAKRNQQRSV